MMTRPEYLSHEILKEKWFRWKQAFYEMVGRTSSALVLVRLINAGVNLVCRGDYFMPLNRAIGWKEHAGEGAIRAYFEALEKASHEALVKQRQYEDTEHYIYFLRCHIYQTVKEFRPALLRRFLNLAAAQGVDVVHDIITFQRQPQDLKVKAKYSETLNLWSFDEVFVKSALRWAVENQDP